jgi:hypothetical protein
VVTLPDALEVLYPNAPTGAYTLADPGSGPTIAAWDEQQLGSQPTSAQIAAVTESQVATGRRDRVIADAVAQIFAARSPIATAILVLSRYGLTQDNDIREHLGLPRITESQHLLGIQAAIAAGAGLPIE